MTNADTPMLAFEGIVESPVNPFTGNRINDDVKYQEEHIIAYTSDYNPETNNGNQFDKIIWVGFRGEDVSDLSKWRVIGETLDENVK